MEQIEVNNNGHKEDYSPEFVNDVMGEGFQVRNPETARPLINMNPQQRAAIHYLASVSDLIKDHYKGDQAKLALIDLAMRSRFFTRKERLAFLDYVDWCDEFEVGYDNAFMYLATSIAESGKSRDELLAGMNSFNYTMTSRNYDSKGKGTTISK